MRFNEPIYIAAASIGVPENRLTAENAAVGSGTRPEAAKWTGFEEVGISDDRPLESLALPAVQNALKDAGWAPDQINLFLYAHVRSDDKKLLGRSHAQAARMIGAKHAFPVSVDQASNGGAAAIELAAGMMAAEPRHKKALVLSLDTWGELYLKGRQWCSGTTLVGDGAAAVLLGRENGPLELVSAASGANTDLEEAWLDAVDSDRKPGEHDDMGFPIEHSAEYRAQLLQCITETVEKALSDAAIGPDDPRLKVTTLPRGGRVAERRMTEAFPKGMPAATHLGAKTGHLGAGDQIANIADVLNEAMLQADDHAALISIGAGLVASCLIVRNNQPRN